MVLRKMKASSIKISILGHGFREGAALNAHGSACNGDCQPRVQANQQPPTVLAGDWLWRVTWPSRGQ